MLELGAASRAQGPVNEDAFLIDAHRRLFAVFDGLGGSRQGAFAAKLAAGAIHAAYECQDPFDDIEAETAFLTMAVQGAGALLSATLEDGLTTASVVKVCVRPDGRAAALICNIGDSRVYRLRPSGELRQCTLDDSMFGTDWDLQLRLSEVVVATDLLESVYLAQRHVIDRVLGEGLHAPNLWTVVLDDDDVLLAVTDGVTDNLTFSELGGVAQASRDNSARAARALVDAAFARSHQASHARAKIDDMTAVVVRVRSDAA
jgi:serine/threonine protein phosphatase PrpC